MTEALRLEEDDDAINFVAQPNLQLVDEDYIRKQELVESLVSQYRADYFGEPGNKGMYESEQKSFVEYLRNEQINDPNPILAESAKQFLTEIGGTDET